jgi:parallel beta-helix repeat protein
MLLCGIFTQPVQIDTTRTTSIVSSDLLPIDTTGLDEVLPITISDNTDFNATYSFPGNGTEDAPFIIENLFISLNTSDWNTYGDSCISVLNTDCYFIIRNCVFLGYVRWDDDPQYIEPVIDIKGCGIKLTFVENAEVYDNRFILTNWPIHAYSTANSTIHHNTIYGNIVTGAPTEYGVFGILFEHGSQNNSVSFNIIQNCLSGVYIFNSLHNSIENNTVFHCDSGIAITSSSESNVVLKNNCSFNAHSGISLMQTTNNFIINNTCAWNAICGILVPKEATNTTISGNLVYGNGGYEHDVEAVGYGIWIQDGGTENNVTWNDIVDNDVNAKNDVSGNVYDFNYWSDYEGVDEDEDGIGDTPYEIHGIATTQDNNPRILPQYTLPSREDTTTTAPSSTDDTPGLDPLLLVLPASLAIVGITIVLIRRR